jgi:hypothetical protein
MWVSRREKWFRATSSCACSSNFESKRQIAMQQDDLLLSFWGHEATMESPEARNTQAYNPEIEDENKRLRRLQIMMSMVKQVISEQSDLSIEEASELVASSRRAALNLFPGKELAYDLIYKPRLQRLMNERFHLQ